MSADSDRAAAYLAEVADLIAKRDTLARSAGAFYTPQDVDEFNAAQDRLAARAAPLAAAVEAVLALHQPEDRGLGPRCKGCQTHVTFTPWPCSTVAAITAALLGEEADRG